jgi:transcriptional regulator with GAF, ATPase, and Fis domain
MRTKRAFDIAQAAPPGSEHTHSEYVPDKIAALQRLVLQMLSEVQAMTSSQIDSTTTTTKLSIEEGVDFYAEVSRFEIDLIERALQITRGNQAQAAHLLNLHPTTLNSKIKHYQISVHQFLPSYIFDERVRIAS